MRGMNFLCLGGPHNGSYLSLREARRLGYRSATDAEKHAWNYEPVVCWDPPNVIDSEKFGGAS